MLKLFTPLGVLLVASACTTTPEAPVVRPEGSLVALGESVEVAGIVLTPLEVTEDSRCPMNARCIWAGEIIVETRVDGLGWSETQQLSLGNPDSVRGYILNLVTAEPSQVAGEGPIAAADYRFAYEGWPPDRPLE